MIRRDLRSKLLRKFDFEGLCADDKMETIFTLPLSVIALIQLLVSLLLLGPKAISLPLSQLISKAKGGTAAKSVLSTILVLLLALFVSSLMELLKGADKIRRGDMRVDVMATVDYLRSQVRKRAKSWLGT